MSDCEQIEGSFNIYDNAVSEAKKYKALNYKLGKDIEMLQSIKIAIKNEFHCFFMHICITIIFFLIKERKSRNTDATQIYANDKLYVI